MHKRSTESLLLFSLECNVGTKIVKIKEMAGTERQEEEPEGEIIVGPSGEALRPHDTGTSLIQRNLSNKKHLSIRSSNQIPIIHLELSCSQMSHLMMMSLRLPLRNSIRLTGHTPGQRQEVCQHWLKMRLLTQVFPLFFQCLTSLSILNCSMAMLDLCDRYFCSFPFHGLHLLQQACFLHTEAHCLEAEGLQKEESAVAGSEAEGLYGLS